MGVYVLRSKGKRSAKNTVLYLSNCISKRIRLFAQYRLLRTSAKFHQLEVCLVAEF